MGQEAFEVAGTANNGDQLEKLLETQVPDLILMDIRMPGRSGIEMTRLLKARHPDLKILIFSGNTPDEQILSALESGADGFVPKNVDRDELIKALNTVAGGQQYFPASVAALVMQQFQQEKKVENPSELTEREIEIIQGFSDGLRYKEIAAKLNISPYTVESHKVKIQKKLKVGTVIEMVKVAIKHGYIEL